MPEIAVTRLFVDPDGRINYTLKNIGNGALPSGVGHVDLYVDGRLAERKLLGALDNQVFRTPFGETTHWSFLRLNGANRYVSVHFDPDRELGQVSRWFNLRTQSLNPAQRQGTDLAPVEIHVAGDSVGGEVPITVEITNRGTETLSSGTGFALRLVIAGQVVHHKQFSTDTLILPGGRWFFTPDPAWRVPPFEPVSIMVLPDDSLADLDNTNNILVQQLAGELEPYHERLADPHISTSINWYIGNERGRLIYEQWTDQMKSDLDQAIIRREKGLGSVLKAPPEVIWFSPNHMTFISDEDAWQVYLEFVTQSLWTDVHRIVPWSLAGMDPVHLDRILGAENILLPSDEHDGYGYIWYFGGVGNIMPWNARLHYDFLDNLGLIKSTREQSVYALTDWIRARLRHRSLHHGTDLEQWVHTGNIPTERMLYPIDSRDPVTKGCGPTTGIYNTLLRTINIPVLRTASDLYFGEGVVGNGGHTRPVFPTLNKALGHGDDPYTFFFSPIHEGVPTHLLFFDYQDAELYETPMPPYLPINMPQIHEDNAVDCAGGRCNTPREQLSYEYLRRAYALDVVARGGSMLNLYANEDQFSNLTLDGELSGERVNFVVPLFSPQEIQFARKNRLE